MRFSLWLLAVIALSTGGCVLPCLNGACSSSGEPRFIPPAARFTGTERLTGGSCAAGSCLPKPYLTMSKYWPRLDQWTSTKTAKRCADRHLLRQQFQCRKWISRHYKCGYRDAFVDVANGENGEVPAIPPAKYWNTHYRTEKGKRCVELYFDGYRAGAAQASADLMPLTTIGASHDWSIQKPKAPFVSNGPFIAGNNCQNGAGSPGGGYSPYGQSQSMALPPGMRSAGCQTGPAAEQPSVFSMNPQPPASGIGPANTYPGPGNYSPAPVPDPTFGQQNNPYAAPPQGRQNLNLPAPNPPRSGLPIPGYANPGSATPGQQLTPSQQPAQPSLPQSNHGGPGAARPQPGNGVLRPGFSGNPPLGRVVPGPLGPPDQFKSDPPAYQVTQPRR